MVFPKGETDEPLIYDGEQERIIGPGQVVDFSLMEHGILDAQGDVRRIRVRFLTPFRFRKGNHFGSRPDFETFMRNVFRRIIFLSIHSPLSFELDVPRLLEKTADVRTGASGLRWFDWQRYSARQSRKMKLGGFLGTLEFSGPLNGFLPYIKLCEFLNVGKNVSFGLGKYEVLSVRSVFFVSFVFFVVNYYLKVSRNFVSDL